MRGAPKARRKRAVWRVRVETLSPSQDREAALHHIGLGNGDTRVTLGGIPHKGIRGGYKWANSFACTARPAILPHPALSHPHTGIKRQQADRGIPLLHHTPPAPGPNTGQVLFQGAKVRKHGVAVFGQARVTARHVPRNTCCRHKATLPPQNMTVQSNRPAYTPEHKSTWNDSYVNTLPPILTPSCSLHNAANHILFWIGTAKAMVPKKNPKRQKQRSPCLDKPL